MNLKEIRELIEFLKEQDIAEFELERGDVKVRIKRGGEVGPPAETRFITVPAAVPVAMAPAGDVAAGSATAVSIPAIAAAPAEKAVLAAENLHLVRSPIVGTFYECPSPGSPPFVKVGDAVTLGQVLCIVEAMKLMNEIEADLAGEIAKVLVKNGQPIEYGQPLFEIRPQS